MSTDNTSAPNNQKYDRKSRAISLILSTLIDRPTRVRILSLRMNRKFLLLFLPRHNPLRTRRWILTSPQSLRLRLINRLEFNVVTLFRNERRNSLFIKDIAEFISVDDFLETYVFDLFCVLFSGRWPDVYIPFAWASGFGICSFRVGSFLIVDRFRGVDGRDTARASLNRTLDIFVIRSILPSTLTRMRKGRYVRIENIAVKVPGREYTSLFTETLGPFSAVGKGIEGCKYSDHNDDEDERDLSCSTGGNLEARAGSEVIP
jgi:hypothetical protein